MSDTPIVLDEPTVIDTHVPGHGRVRVEFPAGPVIPKTDEEHLAAARLADQQAAAKARAQRRAVDSDVPDNVVEVQAWVGDDPARAAAALVVERNRAKGPRKTLEPWLVEKAGLGDGDAGDGGDTEPTTQES